MINENWPELKHFSAEDVTNFDNKVPFLERSLETFISLRSETSLTDLSKSGFSMKNLQVNIFGLDPDDKSILLDMASSLKHFNIDRRFTGLHKCQLPNGFFTKLNQLQVLEIDLIDIKIQIPSLFQQLVKLPSLHQIHLYDRRNSGIDISFKDVTYLFTESNSIRKALFGVRVIQDMNIEWGQALELARDNKLEVAEEFGRFRREWKWC